mmetsp:Transcript_10967/g.24157  ORF Transcript_10967/g.24157 Transcript_10967/m.24157 type:complete len:123 (-) Transcript_10967:438-806(-)
MHGHVNVEVADNAPQQATLGRVFLTEIGIGRSYDVQELGNDGRHAPKMSGARFSFRRFVKSLVGEGFFNVRTSSSTNVLGTLSWFSAAEDGYISSLLGAKTKSTPSDDSIRTSSSSWRGYVP